MTFTPANPVTSPQKDIHNRLEEVVLRHLRCAYQKPMSAHTQTAFEQAYLYWENQGKPHVILDSGCGTGESSRYLSTLYQDCLVIGLDQSEKRLSHSDNAQLPENCLLLRCECMDFWRLAESLRWSFTLHTLFYPNPYPKNNHLQRRWHGSPVFHSLLNISEAIELRTNWSIYAQEFAAALNIANHHGFHTGAYTIQHYIPSPVITAFERKYQQSGHALWRVAKTTGGQSLQASLL
jgi:tRNA (guanine-N7-)-methyltransferase